jgi:hypothetical protein
VRWNVRDILGLGFSDRRGGSGWVDWRIERPRVSETCDERVVLCKV